MRVLVHAQACVLFLGVRASAFLHPLDLCFLHLARLVAAGVQDNPFVWDPFNGLKFQVLSAACGSCSPKRNMACIAGQILFLHHHQNFHQPLVGCALHTCSWHLQPREATAGLLA